MYTAIAVIAVPAKKTRGKSKDGERTPKERKGQDGDTHRESQSSKSEPHLALHVNEMNAKNNAVT